MKGGDFGHLGEGETPGWGVPHGAHQGRRLREGRPGRGGNQYFSTLDGSPLGPLQHL